MAALGVTVNVHHALVRHTRPDAIAALGRAARAADHRLPQMRPD